MRLHIVRRRDPSGCEKVVLVVGLDGDVRGGVGHARLAGFSDCHGVGDGLDDGYGHAPGDGVGEGLGNGPSWERGPGDGFDVETRLGVEDGRDDGLGDGHIKGLGERLGLGDGRVDGLSKECSNSPVPARVKEPKGEPKTVAVGGVVGSERNGDMQMSLLAERSSGVGWCGATPNSRSTRARERERERERGRERKREREREREID